ncbi:MAG TPA: hypothetical protein VFN25_01285 [Dokdonella sp.]|uniref:hypothetical protein n=1 Tax=Dokdonella sp. TaxID=2291710 RepID=UPI002D80CC54|nr:hypothetical protein [Dokdonella sp.]HET9031515.1 hypothetical protein [Dokdonella sp.]
MMRRTGLILALLIATGTANAANWTVTQSGPSGVGSFTWALTQANAADATEQQIIEFDLPIGQRRIRPLVASPWPSINHPDVIIDGGEPSDLFSSDRITLEAVRGNGFTFANTLLHVGPDARRLKLRDLSVISGFGRGLGNCLNAQLARADIQIEIDRVTFAFCQSQGNAIDGTGAFGGAIFSVGGLTIRDSLFYRNEANTGDQLGIVPPNSVSAAGGAIAIYYGTVLIQRTGFIENKVLSNEHQAWGGAIAFLSAEAGYLTIIDSHFQSNSIERVSAIAQNLSRIGGAIHSLAAKTHINRSSFVDNSALAGGALAASNAGAGGQTTAEFKIENSLIASNTAELDGGGVYFDWPGLRYSQRNATFVDNDLVSGIRGRHMAIRAGSLLQTSHSIIFGDSGTAGVASSCEFEPGVVPIDASVGNSLSIEEGSFQSCSAAGAFPVADNDAIGLSPAGPISTAIGNQYWPLVAGGLAIDGGAAGAPSDSDWSRCSPSDVLGTARPVDGDGNGSARCDIGSFEYRIPEAPIFANGFD